MIDLHTHTLFSDGALIPSELVRRAEVIGYSAIALTDHVDMSNYEIVVSNLARFCGKCDNKSIKVLPGVEITHAPPGQFKELTRLCRELGAKVVLAHGETMMEPVAPGTNRAAIEAGVDIIAHPGFITDEEASMAAGKGVALEISGRFGHSFTNGHVGIMARKHGANLLFCTDAHQPGDLMERSTADKVSRGAGLNESEIEKMFQFAAGLVERLG